jgi:hypothetical protein
MNTEDSTSKDIEEFFASHPFELFEEPKSRTMKILPNWFKRSLKIRRKTLRSIKYRQIGHCGLCDTAFLLYHYYEAKENGSFQASDCACTIHESEFITDRSVYLASTSYGSNFDGCVFLIHDLPKIGLNKNCCDQCILKHLKTQNFEFLYDYVHREYNPKLESLAKEVLNEYFSKYSVYSVEEAEFFNSFYQENTSKDFNENEYHGYDVPTAHDFL